MPIRYFIDLNCVPREDLGADELLSLVNQRQRANALSARFEEQYQVTDETKMRFRENQLSPAGEEEASERSVAELREETAVLEELAGHCEGCPAALTGGPYSCIQSITLPIGAAAEEWLLAQLAPQGTRALELYIDTARRANYGKASLFRNWRKAGFLEAPEALRETRNEFDITSDQLLNELFLVGDLMPGHALGVLIHFQALVASDGRRGDDLLALLENVDQTGSAEEAPTIDFAIEVTPEDDESTREVKQFLFALFKAFSLQVPLAVRL